MAQTELCEQLLKNSKSALIAAIEIYNKPVFEYREECVSVLLVNAWELALKALLVKNQEPILYKQKESEPQRSLSWQDALKRAEQYFPKSIPFNPVADNLRHLAEYRNNTMHYYNETDMKTIIYMLAQGSVKNLVDLMSNGFGVHVSEEINWKILPIGITPPVDPVSYLSASNTRERSKPVQQFLSKLTKSVHSATQNGEDASRLIVGVQIKLVSTKQAGDADVVVGVTGIADAGDATVVEKKVDPNDSHPHLQKDVMAKIRVLHGKKITTYTFQAIAWKYDLKENQEYCWQSKIWSSPAYSNEIVRFLKQLSAKEIEESLAEYKQHQAQKRKEKSAHKAMRA